ncbi:MAG: hypothetical protein HAW67_00650 [Endozoicomonadaceae bacterium]|nr:hypothetical protein [Endozoicomonadaceae bacterium]
MNILAIGAHFDDIELGCGATLARHVKRGDKVTVYVATVSGYTDHNNEQVRSNVIAREEASKAMEILGVHEFICGQFKTCELEFIDELNIEILRIVENKKIDMVYGHWIGDIHHDHSALAKASLHGCRHVQRYLMYRSNWYHTSIDFHGNFYVDISGYWEIKQKSIEAHVSEMERTGKKWISFFKNEAENAGQRIGVEKAEVFEVIKWLET